MTQTMESAATSISRESFLRFEAQGFHWSDRRLSYNKVPSWLFLDGKRHPAWHCGLVHTNTVLVTFLWLTHILKRNCHRGPYFLVALEYLLFHAFQGRMCPEPFIALKCKQRQSQNSKADDQKEIQGARNKFNGKKRVELLLERK